MFGRKLKEIRQQKHLSMDALAKNLNKKYNTKISKSMISHWENGQTDPSISYVRILMDYFNKGYEYFIDVPKPKNIHPISDRVRRIPIIGTIAMGTPITAEENVIGHTSEEFDDVPKDELFALECKGHSMEPTIPDGAIAIFEATSQVEDGEIAAVLLDHDEEATLKRVQHSPDGQIFLKPDNNSFPTIALNDKNPGRIIGRLYEFKVLAHRK